MHLILEGGGIFLDRVALRLVLELSAQLLDEVANNCLRRHHDRVIDTLCARSVLLQIFVEETDVLDAAAGDVLGLDLDWGRHLRGRGRWRCGRRNVPASTRLRAGQAAHPLPSIRLRLVLSNARRKAPADSSRRQKPQLSLAHREAKCGLLAGWRWPTVFENRSSRPKFKIAAGA